MTVFDDPNREAVGLDPIWTGAGEAPPEGDSLDSMTKDQLLDHAAGLGVDVPSGATKAEIRAAIDDAG